MGNRHRNTALLLIIAGLYLFFGHLFGFLVVSALLILWLAYYLIKTSHGKKGYILLGVGAILLLSGHITLLLAAALLAAGFYMFWARHMHKDGHFSGKYTLLESVRHDKEPWIAASASSWALVGEIKLDFSVAIFDEPEVNLVYQGVVGDVDILIPEDLGLSLNATILLGQTEFGHNKEAGFGNKLVWKSPHYDSSEYKINLEISYVIGDLDIKVL